MDSIERLLAISHYGSRWVLWLLIALSIAALAVVIERAVLFFSSRDDTVRLRLELRRRWRGDAWTRPPASKRASRWPVSTRTGWPAPRNECKARASCAG